MTFELPLWNPARRAARMNPSILREILKVTDRPGILSMAGGLPSPDTFPVEAMRAACDKVLRETPREALQYAASEGFMPLREELIQDPPAIKTASGFACFSCKASAIVFGMLSWAFSFSIASISLFTLSSAVFPPRPRKSAIFA